MNKNKTAAKVRALLCSLLALLLITNVHAQQGGTRKITGTVKDNQGNPVQGASVEVKETKAVTATDQLGVFTLQVTSNAKNLVISSVGMITREINIGSSSLIEVRMEQLAQKLDEVVVIGYGTAKRANLTSAQTTVSAKDIDKTINTTIEQAIQGRAAGVYITQNSGQPGGGISVNIRGVSTVNGTTEPLYVIDGVQVMGESVSFGAQSSTNPIAGLNPSDIQDIQLLQGPSATAIYGSRATNGVILITTKRGKSGQAKLEYNFLYSVQTPPKHLEVMNLQQYAQMVKEMRAIVGGEVPQEFLDPSLLGKGTDWQSELFNNAPMSKHALSMSGGNDKTTYYMSGEYLDQDGIAIGSGFKRYSFRVNLDNKPREWITLGANLNFNQTDEVLTTSQENVISNAIRLTPQIPVKNIDGTWGGGDINNGANQFAPVNPIAIANMTTNNFVRRQFLGGLNLGINITKGLVFRSSFNANVGYQNSTYYIPQYKIGWAVNDRPTLTNGNNFNTYWNWNQMLDYNRTFGKHSVGLMLTHEAQESRWKNVSSSRTGFLTNDILDLNAGDETTATNSGGSGVWGMESYLGRLSYNFDSRYILNATIRRDGSANFGENNKIGYFPSLSVAWRLSQEPFFKVPFISEFKLRFETGVTGNQGGGAFIYSPMIAGATPTGTGFLPGRYKNPDLKWEETKTNNFGLNLGFANNRIQLEFDYYIKHTNNLLMPNPLPWYMGTNGTGSVESPYINVGDIQTKGWGATLITTNIANKNFKWETNFNISAFKSTIERFYSEAALINRTSWWLGDWTQRSVVGQAPWLFRGYIEEGLFTSIEEIEKSPVPVDNNGNRLPIDQTNGLWVGDVKFKDISGPDGTPDGKIDVYDETFIGNPWPKLFAGFTNTFSYKNFDLSILLTGTYGNDIYNYLARVNSNPNNTNVSQNLLIKAMEYARPTEVNGVVQLENPRTDVARISYGPNGNYTRHTNKWVEDGSYIRIKNITLSYNLSQDFLNRQQFIKGARFSISAQNIYTLTRYKGFDPEVGAYVGRDASASNQAIGLDYGRYPLTPVISLSLGVNF
ncbi:TonB-dependent receptor [Terrimonas sp.]|uniref:SusC/RagA family TonB-linked outer membrane protein n=1 Tax=Terrimonas sp. TaxID=1914338 RepID=UPI000D5114A3|nr:TonB-dependent receptor [Terrimonas sp.]PVD53709.1 TonB-dependent receptor [Terrimonas sp.]